MKWMHRWFRVSFVALSVLGTACASDNQGGPDPECGNGVAETGEQCDGADLMGGSCLALGFDTGHVTCLPSCMYDMSDCADAHQTCGNGVLEGDEACDDANLANADGCDLNCDVEAGFTCEGQPSVCTGPTCGDDHVDPGEDCELSNLNGHTCQSLGYDGGMLSCNQADCTFNVSSCSGDPCGNSQIDYGEDCDTYNLDLQSCAGLGFQFGMLACNADCSFDTSNCSNDPCGNGILDASELCDGNNLDGQSCTDHGFVWGALACHTDCTFDTSGCSSDPCGNGTLDTGEECDTTELNGHDCVSQGFYWGALACATGCTFDTSGCSSDPCGNGTLDTGEDCDGADLGGQDCTDHGFLAGSLTCAPGCSFDLSACANAVCGDGSIQPGEQCDDGNLIPGDGCSATCTWEGTCTLEGSLTSGITVGGQVLYTVDDLHGYSCPAGTTNQGDHIYSFVPTSSGTATALLNVLYDFDYDDIFYDDINLHVLEGGCNPGLCIASGTLFGDDEISFGVTAGLTYYVAVELELWSLIYQGDYDLTVTWP